MILATSAHGKNKGGKSFCATSSPLAPSPSSGTQRPAGPTGQWGSPCALTDPPSWLHWPPDMAPLTPSLSLTAWVATLEFCAHCSLLSSYLYYLRLFSKQYVTWFYRVFNFTYMGSFWIYFWWLITQHVLEIHLCLLSMSWLSFVSTNAVWCLLYTYVWVCVFRSTIISTMARFFALWTVLFVNVLTYIRLLPLMNKSWSGA